LLDGDKGKVIVNPGKKQVGSFEARIKKVNQYKDLTIKKSKQKAHTKDGKRILVHANASNEEDFKEAMRNGCDGIGFFRIESLYLEHKTAPSEQYLNDHLKSILKYARNKKVVIRLLDVGGDKQLSYINVEDERNPFLGLRGVRLLLKYKNILKTQLQVISNLADEFNVKILVPMITLPKEMQEIRNVIKTFQKNTKSKVDCEIGAMIETPASVANIEEIAKASDFLSIGTNDLIQYTMAVGRENMSMAEYYHEGAETIMKLISDVVQVADKLSVPCSVCGEIAGDAEYVEQLLRSGVKELSVSPSRIPLIKEKIRTIKL
jgi:phosphoenolpyruvate-protein kinase (PTS system EI component)